jgi:hypothetical protein
MYKGNEEKSFYRDVAGEMSEINILIKQGKVREAYKYFNQVLDFFRNDFDKSKLTNENIMDFSHQYENLIKLIDADLSILTSRYHNPNEDIILNNLDYYNELLHIGFTTHRYIRFGCIGNIDDYLQVKANVPSQNNIHSHYEYEVNWQDKYRSIFYWKGFNKKQLEEANIFYDKLKKSFNDVKLYKIVTKYEFIK